MRRGLAKRIVVASSAAALAFTAVACEAGGEVGGEGGIEQPADTGGAGGGL